MQHTEYVSHLPKIKSPAAKTTVTEEWRAQKFCMWRQGLLKVKFYLHVHLKDLHLSDVTGVSPGAEEWAGRIFLTSQLTQSSQSAIRSKLRSCRHRTSSKKKQCWGKKALRESSETST